MTRSIFGWDLPPGCSIRDIEEAFGGEDPSPESEKVYELTDKLRSTPAEVSQDEIDALAKMVDDLVTENVRTKEDLSETNRSLALLLRAGKHWADFHEPDSLLDQKDDPRLREEAKRAEEQLLEIINEGGY